MTEASRPSLEPSSFRGAVFSLEGEGFHTGWTNRLRLAVATGGIGWIRIDGNCHPVWGAGSMPVASGRCTRSDGIGPLEHLSAAALCHGSDGWILDADHGDLPIFDGSARVWKEAFAEIAPAGEGRVEASGLGARRWESPRGGILEIAPADNFHLRVEWTNGPGGGEVWEGDEIGLHETLDARTFVEADDWLAAKSAGLLKGTGTGSGRLFRGRKPSEQALDIAAELGLDAENPVWIGGLERLPNECAAHKAMDLAGDIGCWIGYLPKLSILARDAGHDLHHRLGLALRESTGNVRGK